MSKRRIVILGGGFGGVSVVKQLLKSDCYGEIILIDRRNKHVFTPWLYEVATGFLFSSTKKHLQSLRNTSGIRFENFIYAQESCGFRFRKADVSFCDFASRHVVFKDGKTIRYDDLVIALGSETNFFNIPGLEANAFILRSLTDAARLQRCVSAFVEDLRSGYRDHIKIVICGAGPVGMELSAEMANTFNAAAKKQRIDRSKIEVSLIEAGETVLQQLHSTVRQRARHRLDELGVRLQLQTRVEAVRPHELFVARLANDKKLQKQTFDLLVWTGGIRANKVLGNMKLEKDHRGRIVVEPTMQVRDLEGVYAIGDAASYISPYTKRALPALAQVAVKQGKFVAKNIIRKQQGKPLQTLHVPRKWITVTSIGGAYAIIHLLGFTFSKRLGSYFRKMVDLHYFATLLPWPVFWRVWRKARYLFSQND